MGKHLDKLGTFDSFRAPWETEAGSDAEIDKPKLKRLIYNLKKGEAESLDSVEDVKANLATATEELEEAKKQAASANGDEAQKTIDKLQKKVDDLTGERDRLVSANEQRETREKVLGDFAAKHPKAAKYVTGTTEEELEASLAAVKEDFGITDGDDGDGDDEGDDDEKPVRTTPRVRTLTSGTGNTGKEIDSEVDFDKVAESIIGGGNTW